MAASRLDMFWAEAADVDAATESPTKNARESLFAYLMELSSICYVDFTPCIIFWLIAIYEYTPNMACGHPRLLTQNKIRETAYLYPAKHSRSGIGERAFGALARSRH
jgi:hypothetical protein